MPSGDVTYFCEYYGRYFLIGYYLSEIENLLLLTEGAKGNIRFDRLNETYNCCVRGRLVASLCGTRLSKKFFVGFHMARDLSRLRRSRSAALRPKKDRSACLEVEV